MDATEAMRLIIEASRKSGRQVAREIGRSDSCRRRAKMSPLAYGLARLHQEQEALHRSTILRPDRAVRAAGLQRDAGPPLARSLHAHLLGDGVDVDVEPRVVRDLEHDASASTMAQIASEDSLVSVTAQQVLIDANGQGLVTSSTSSPPHRSACISSHSPARCPPRSCPGACAPWAPRSGRLCYLGIHFVTNPQISFPRRFPPSARR